MEVRETSGKKCVQGFKYVIEFNPGRKKFLTENALIELHKKIGNILNIQNVSKRFFEVYYMDEEMINECKMKVLAEDYSDAEMKFKEKHPTRTTYMTVDLSTC